MVAENSSVWRSAGVASRMNSRSSRKPRSSISSASSSTAALRPVRIEAAAFEVVAQAAGCADDDVRAKTKLAGFGARVHAADAGDDAGAGLGIEPGEFALDLQGEFAGRRDDEGERIAGPVETFGIAEQGRGEGEAEGDGLAGAGLGRDEQIAAGAHRLRGRQAGRASARCRRVRQAPAQGQDARQERSCGPDCRVARFGPALAHCEPGMTRGERAPASDLYWIAW